MNKQTQMYVGLGVAVVAGYLIYNNWKKNQPAKTTAAPATDAAPSVATAASFAGLDADSVVGERKGMVGMDATMKQNAVVKDSAFAWGNFAGGINGVIQDGTFASADGSISSHFFDTHDSANNFRNR